MWRLFAVFAVASCVGASPQEIKSIKSGHGGRDFNYDATANLVRFYNGSQQQNHSLHNNTHKLPLDFERGVCYIEVPTASLAHDPAHIPAGNGSTPDLSRIRACCKGYIRNIHNFRLCDPVCTEECVNGLCTAPDTCTCFPDHVRNLAGFCIATCPIGCQNGVCSGDECWCKEGFKQSSDKKYCVPSCKGNCGGLGNCTAPDTCECSKGFAPGPEGTCRASCGNCDNGECVGPDNCVCYQGFEKNQFGECVPSCPQGCGNGQCIAPNICSCPHGLDMDAITKQCVPKCSKPCYNGICAGADRCACNPGYVLDKEDATGSRCVPSCPGGCPNGICSAPNFCICNLGYVKDRGVKGHPVCVKRARRSVEEKVPVKISDLLVFKVPDDDF